MTPKMFLHRANGKISADAFLKQHREFLESGELAMFTSPILAKVDSKELLPTPGLDELKRIVLSHHLQEEICKAEASMAKAQEGGGGSRKPYLGEIHDKEGTVLLEQAFNTPQECEGWLDRRLFDGEPDCFGVCIAQFMMTKEGEPMTSVVMRGDAIARILKKTKGPVMKAQAKSAGKLSWGAKVKQSHASFSRG